MRERVYKTFWTSIIHSQSPPFPDGFFSDQVDSSDLSIFMCALLYHYFNLGKVKKGLKGLSKKNKFWI